MAEGETFDLEILRPVVSNICDEGRANLFPSKSFSLFFPFYGDLFNFQSCKVGAYSWIGAYFIATILQVIRYRDILIFVGVRKCK